MTCPLQADLKLRGEYIIDWEDYSQPNELNNGLFRYIIVQVSSLAE